MNRIAFPSIVICAVIARLVVLLFLASQPPTEDAQLYDETGTDIASLLRAGESPSMSEQYYIQAAGTQAYALFTGVFYYLFGHHYALVLAFNSILPML